jgi:hypothetical protein
MDLTSARGIFDAALWLAGWGHFTLLLAGGQLPYRLGWKEELARVRPMTRKLVWVYWVFILTTVVGFGVLTLVLHDELLRGDRAALALATFMTLFWAIRLGADFLYFDHADWPSGKWLLLCHVLLTSFFVFLLATYTSLLLWHAWGTA